MLCEKSQNLFKDLVEINKYPFDKVLLVWFSFRGYFLTICWVIQIALAQPNDSHEVAHVGSHALPLYDSVMDSTFEGRPMTRPSHLGDDLETLLQT